MRDPLVAHIGIFYRCKSACCRYKILEMFRSIAALILLFLGTLHPSYADEPQTRSLYVRWETTSQHPSDFNTGKKLVPFSDSVQEVSSFSDIQSRLAELTNASLKTGDQVIILIDTHGVPSSGTEKSHAISLSDGMPSLDEIEPYLQKLTSAGVNVALIDTSCFSAPSLSFATTSPELQKHLCVITGDAVSLPSFASFSSHLDESMGDGASMEDWFRKARRKDTFGTGSPAISTEASRACGKALADVDKIMASADFWNYEDVFKVIPTQPCKTPSQYPAIQNLLESMKPIVDTVNENDPDVEFLYSALSKITRQVADLRKKHPDLVKEMTKTRRLSDGQELTWAEASRLMFSSTEWPRKWSDAMLKKILQQNDVPIRVRGKIMNHINNFDPTEFTKFIEEAPSLADYLRKEEPNFRRYYEIQKFAQEGRPKLLDSLTKEESLELNAVGLGARLATASPERNLFERCYQKYLENHPPDEDSPCRKIKFRMK